MNRLTLTSSMGILGFLLETRSTITFAVAGACIIPLLECPVAHR